MYRNVGFIWLCPSLNFGVGPHYAVQACLELWVQTISYPVASPDSSYILLTVSFKVKT